MYSITRSSSTSSRCSATGTPLLHVPRTRLELVSLEAYEATRNLEVVDKPIETPVAPMVGKQIAKPRPIIVPVLRAGLGMLDGMTRMMPSAEVGFLGNEARRRAPDPADHVREPPA